MKMLFKEFFQLDEMPHLDIRAKNTDPFAFDFEIEYFGEFKTEEERLRKFQELKDYIGRLTAGNEVIVHGPYNEDKDGFWTNDKTKEVARNIFKTNKQIQFNILNLFGNLISDRIKPVKMPITKRDSDEISVYQNWVDTVISKYQERVFNENKPKVLDNNNINNIK